jgi:hypothetical protein
LEWSGRVDLNHRPPGPEPDSKPYGRLLNFVVSNCFLLNELGPPVEACGTLLFLGDLTVYNFIYSPIE